MKTIGIAILLILISPLAPTIALLWIVSKLPNANKKLQSKPHSEKSPGYELLMPSLYSELLRT